MLSCRWQVSEAFRVQPLLKLKWQGDAHCWIRTPTYVDSDNLVLRRHPKLFIISSEPHTQIRWWANFSRDMFKEKTTLTSSLTLRKIIIRAVPSVSFGRHQHLVSSTQLCWRSSPVVDRVVHTQLRYYSWVFRSFKERLELLLSEILVHRRCCSWSVLRNSWKKVQSRTKSRTFIFVIAFCCS